MHMTDHRYVKLRIFKEVVMSQLCLHVLHVTIVTGGFVLYISGSVCRL